MKKITFMLMLLLCATVNAANTTKTVSQVTDGVALTTNVDYVITGETPFATTGSVDIQSTEHAVLIIQAAKPSVTKKKWLKYVYINGEAAVDGTNCMVRSYGRGSIIFPYGSDFAPLTCYTEKDFGGESCNTYTEGSSGGFMKTLSTAALNNRIRSFKLKRGYMVTFALGTGGWGYSRCFIAHDEDLEMNMPTNMDSRVSSYRVFKWWYAHKAGLASTGSATENSAVNSSWCYDWAAGNASLEPDREWVPNHIYEDWPSPSACGSVTQSCHMKTNNEPYNKSDDHPQTVEDILANWQNLMRTGMRLCTPSSWDGSDYWNGDGYCIKPFLDSIDARGWRCDLVDAHCYWTEGTFGALQTHWWPNYHRPIWVSEWIWGASWNGNGCWGSGVTNQDIYNTTVRILNNLNSMGAVERYAYWNGESKGHIYENGGLTDLGSFYSTMDVGIGYNKSYEFIPTVVYAKPQNLTGTYNKKVGTFTITWNDVNGDMLDSITVECKVPGSTRYVRLATLQPKDRINKDGPSYTYVDTPEESGAYYYRICNYKIGEKTLVYSDELANTVTASYGIEGLQYGSVSVTNTDAVSTDFSEYFDATPAVFMGICTNSNSSLYPGNLITSAGMKKFNYQVLPWTKQGASAATTLSKPEELPFLAMASGNYKYGNLDCEVGVAKIARASKGVGEITFAQPFPDGVTPIVIVEIRNPTYKTDAIATSLSDITNTGFKVVCQYETGVGKDVSFEINLSYLAITPGKGDMIHEVSDSVVIDADTVSTQVYHLDNYVDSIVYTIDQTIRDTYTNVIVAAGIGENNMYGASARDCTFKDGDEILYFKKPRIFGKCQSSNYTGATILRQSSKLTDTDQSSEHYGYVYGAKVKRQHDSSNPCKTTAAYSDPLGWVVIDNADDTYAERFKRVEAYELVDVTPTKVDAPEAVEAPAEIVTIYNLSGMPIPKLQKGVNVVKYSNGKFKKLFVR